MGLVLAFPQLFFFSRHRFVFSAVKAGDGSVLVSGLCISSVLRVLFLASFVSQLLYSNTVLVGFPPAPLRRALFDVVGYGRTSPCGGKGPPLLKISDKMG